MIKDVSLIIPCQNADTKLFQLFKIIPNWEIIPNEIIVIDSSLEKILIPKDFELFVKEQNIDFLLIYKKNLFPGHARNIGISKAKNSVLAFLDTSTSPSDGEIISGLYPSDCAIVTTDFFSSAYANKVSLNCVSI